MDKIYENASDLHVRVRKAYANTDDGYIYHDSALTQKIVGEVLKDSVIKGMIIEFNGALYRPVRLVDHVSGYSIVTIKSDGSDYNFYSSEYTSGAEEPGAEEPGAEEPGIDAYRANRILVWEEDFNDNTLDTSIWNYELGNFRNSTELQCYTNSTNNVYLSNGNLVLKAIRESIDGCTWSSGSIETNNKFEYKTGRLEAKIKVPQISGSFPAFWLIGQSYDYQYRSNTENDLLGSNLGKNWPYQQEIDIMEHFGDDSNIQAGIWVNVGSGQQHLAIDVSGTLDFSEYHVYSYEWDDTYVRFYVDDVFVSEQELTNAYYSALSNPCYIVLNHAVGASGGTPAADTENMEMMVDWIRLYAPATVTSTPAQNPTGITLDQSTLTCVTGGVYTDLTPTLLPTNSYFVDHTINWTSSNTSVATVYGGRVRGIAAGTAIITATDAGGHTATCTVTVPAVPAGTVWDSSWDASDGLMSEAEWLTMTSSAAASAYETAGDPMTFSVAQGTYLKYALSDVSTTDAQLEMKFTISSATFGATYGTGVRLQLCTGASGGVRLHISKNSESGTNYLCALDGTDTYTPLCPINVNTDYIINLAVDANGYTVTVNGSVVHESSTLCTSTALTSSAIFLQSANGTLAGSIEYVKYLAND